MSADGPPEARLLDHAYDGIQEYDNPLPGWWTLIFAGSIAFATAYGFYVQIAHRGTTPAAKYAAALSTYESKRELRARADALNVSEPSLQKAAQDPSTVAHGAQLFQQRCVTCHGDRAQGLIGPNLTDLAQLHGATRMDLYTTISGGVPGTAMLAWGEQMPMTDILALASYVTSLRGTNVEGKEPQGAPVEKFTP